VAVSLVPWRSLIRGSLGGALTWVLAVLLILVIYFSPRHIVSAQTAVAGLIGAGILCLAVKRPDRSLILLIVLLPFQGLILARLWAWGLPTSVVSHLGAWKEALALGVVIAGARSFITNGRRADTLDRIALGFVACVAVYALLQPEIIPSAPSTSSIRLLDFRQTAGFVLVLLGARHAPLGPGFPRRACRILFAVGGFSAIVGLYGAAFSSAWNHFVVHTIRYPAYEIGVLHTQPANPNDIRVYGYIGGTRIVRIGSVFLSELYFAFYLLIPFAIGIERAVRRRASPLTLLTTVAIGAALLLTQTRSAILGALVIILLALAPAAGRPRHWRMQVAILLTALAIVAVPAALSSGVVKRFQQVSNQGNTSTAGHEHGFWSGLDTLGAHPLGQGLGTGAGVGQRFAVSGDQVPENNYLDVGDEIGILPMLVFAALTITVILQLRRIGKVRDDPLVTAMWAAGAGLALTAWFLQTWLDFGVAWTYWGIAGAMVGLSSHPATEVAGPGIAEAAGPALAPSYEVAEPEAVASASR
jgi:hypothetical protein